MGKGYAEGPAAEAAEEERDRLARGDRPRRRALRRAVFGSTPEQPEKHFLGWADEVDVDALFASGAAFGLHVAAAQVGADGAPIG
jgi:hypothetical protein